MVTTESNIDNRLDLSSKIETLVSQLGEGRVNGVAYDTAWVARLSSRYPGYGFDQSLEWLRQHQYEDGTWGAPVRHYHDRFLSTLAAIVALREVGHGLRDERRVKRGENALWKLLKGLRKDDSDTIGFPLLSVSLAEEATAMGLEVPLPPLRHAKAYRRKVSLLLDAPVRNWRASPLSHSLEGVYKAVQSADEVLEENHSSGISLSATAGYLLSHYNVDALDYLRNTIAKYKYGFTPALAPIDVFEIAWSLIHLRAAGAIKADDPVVRKLAARLWENWSPEVGVSTSTYFSVSDIDDTAACFTILQWCGYDVSGDVFAHYELDDHFACFHGETNPALSAHVRLLIALRGCEDHPKYPLWIGKILNALRMFDHNGSFWWDKWHASPYYVNSAALLALHGIADDLAHTRLKWIVRTQNDDGGWGYYGRSTPEETAYCLSALLQWHRNVARLQDSILDEAAQYLETHYNEVGLTPLWIGKSLYTPSYVVRAAVLGALYSYKSQYV